MQVTYNISGMTCGGCLNRVKTALEALPTVSSAEIDLATGEAVLEQQTSIPLETLQTAIGHYTIEQTSTVTAPAATTEQELPPIAWQTYRPLLIIVGYILGVSLLVQYPFDNFSGMTWMRHFMAGFFLVFSFFKMLNLKGFAESYSMYDLVAARWRTWGYIYPFVELGLGILYLTNLVPFYTNLITIIVLGVSTIGVIESNLNQRKIKCACLGDVFNLPMSTVTIIEDVSMVLMAIGGLWMAW